MKALLQAAAVAACLVPMAVGSDTGGSIRMPCYFCGLFGHMPTTGTISTKGIYFRTGEETDPTMSTAGTLTRYAEDISPMLKLLVGENVDKLKLDTQVNMKQLRLSFVVDFNEMRMSRLNGETRTVLEKAVSYLEERCGTKANKVTLPELSHSYNLWHYWLEREWHTLAYELGNKQVDLSYSYRLPCQNCLTATTSGTTDWRGSGTPWLTNWAINSYNLWHYWLEREWHTLAYELGNKQLQVTLPELSHSYNLWHYWLEREWHTLAYELGNKQVTLPELSHSYNLWHYWLEREWHTLAYELGNKQLQVTVPELSHSYNLWHYWLEREWHTLAYELGNKQLQVTLPELSHSYNLWHYWLEREWHTLAYELGNKQLQVTVPELSHSYNLWHYWLEREWHTLAYELGNKQYTVSGVRELVKMVLGRSEFTVPTVLKLLESSLLPVTPKQWAEDKTAKLRQTLIEKLGDDGVLVLPSFPTTAHQHYVPFFRPFNFCFWAIVNVLHFPATQVPLGLSRDGLPLGLQVKELFHGLKVVKSPSHELLFQVGKQKIITRCQIWTEGWVFELVETHSHRAACALRLQSLVRLSSLLGHFHRGARVPERKSHDNKWREFQHGQHDLGQSRQKVSLTVGHLSWFRIHARKRRTLLDYTFTILSPIDKPGLLSLYLVAKLFDSPSPRNWRMPSVVTCLVVATPYNDHLCIAVVKELENGFGGYVPPCAVVATPYNDHLCIAIAQELENAFGGYVPPCAVVSYYL
ncbi:hypothetical protein J6590_036845 [Homalodisca vitripennis]|nr:hypothetical protein J6590_036845 [Homalodisca vitripennis]